MLQNEFEALDRDLQIERLYREAVYLGKRRSTYGVVVLYQLNEFYVEIFYLKYRQKIGRIHCFTSTSFLEPYLSEVDVEILINS